MSDHEVTDELRKIYEDAWDEGIWLLEFSPGDGGNCLTAAGWLSDIERLEKHSGQEIDISKFGLGDVINISCPGCGTTREDSCRNAIKELKEHGQSFIVEPDGSS